MAATSSSTAGFMALNGGLVRLRARDALFVDCETQDEVHEYGEAVPRRQRGPCGWLTNRFGVSWQVVRGDFGELLGDADTEKANRAMQAMLQMKRIDIAELERAAEAG